MEELLEEIRRQWGKPVHCAHCDKTDGDFHMCSQCNTVFCDAKCQAVGDLCRIGGGVKRDREEKKPVHLTRDAFSVIMKFLELDDLKNVSKANKKLTAIARQAMINRYRWTYDPIIMERIKPKRIFVNEETYDDYISDKVVMETDLVTSVYLHHVHFGYEPIFPNHVEHIVLHSAFGESIDLSDKMYLKKIEFIELEDAGFNGPLILPPNLEELNLGHSFSQPLNLPDTLRELTFDGDSTFNLPLVLPPNLTYLLLPAEYNQPIDLPSRLENITLGEDFNQPIQFPDSVTTIMLMSDVFNQPGTRLPPNLKTIIISGHLTEFEFPTSVEHLGISSEYADAFGITITEGRSMNGIKIQFI